MNDKLILVGVIIGAHGIRGDVVVRSFTEVPKNICNLELLNETVAGSIPCNLRFIRQNSKGDLICKINNINDRNSAELLKRTKIFCLRSKMPQVAQDEFYIEDLKGIKVMSKDLSYLGNVINVFNFGAGDILEIEFIESSATEFIAFTKLNFPEVAKDHIVLSDFCISRPNPDA